MGTFCENCAFVGDEDVHFTLDHSDDHILCNSCVVELCDLASVSYWIQSAIDLYGKVVRVEAESIENGSFRPGQFKWDITVDEKFGGRGSQNPPRRCTRPIAEFERFVLYKLRNTKKID